jgi:large subunit ribosomal protein L9|tara:strand:- start:5552 stop:6232 length:681 start_codon:yes stop_codon:yes gene_type:complete
MNVILLEKIGKLGEIGDTASVKSGYARNFLFPQGKAIPATKANLTEFEGRKTELLAKYDAKLAESQRRAKLVNGVSLSIEVNASDEGHLFGSVGTREIADAVNALAGSDIAKREVLLPNGAIRELGAIEVALDLGHDIRATISLAVVSLKSAAGVSEDGSIIEEIDQREAAEAAEASTADAVDAPAAKEATEMSAQSVEASGEEAPAEEAAEAVSETKTEADDSSN